MPSSNAVAMDAGYIVNRNGVVHERQRGGPVDYPFENIILTRESGVSGNVASGNLTFAHARGQLAPPSLDPPGTYLLLGALPRGIARWAVLWFAGISALGCGARSELEDGSRSDAGGGFASGGTGGPSGTSGSLHSSSAANGSGSTSSGVVHGCEGLPGPKMIEVATAEGASYCIDSTEVTNDDYEAFVAANVSIDSQPPECDFNQSWLPHPTNSPGVPVPWPKPGFGRYPINWIDWCDARAYCAFAGKRLCGLIGGGANPADDEDPSANEWTNACTGQGKNAYAYGNTYVEGNCNVGSHSFDDITAAVASFPQCEGGFPGLFDMVGNVSEFVANCSGGYCPLMGASWLNSLDCGSPFSTAIGSGGAIIGIRCCKDAD